jgi:[acyl-carrier-protein] S-malonyltransferase
MSDAGQKILYLFPGQGSQYMGMGSDLLEEFDAAREVFGRASEAVGYDIAELCCRDPAGQLDLTQYTQPALVTHQLACMASLHSLMPENGATGPMLAAGHSLGEYSALVAGGAVSIEDAVILVKNRGELMGEFGEGSMLATTLDLSTAAELAAKHYCAVAGCNLPDQTVIAGQDADLDNLAEDMSMSHPRKRAFRLRTGGAFHTYLMVEAAKRFRDVLAKVEFGPLELGVLSNYTGSVHVSSAEAIRSRLFFQLFNPVRWVDCMNTAIDQDVNTIIELGGGIGKGDGPGEKRPNLEGMVKKSLKARDREVDYLPAINAAGIHLAAERLLDN